MRFFFDNCTSPAYAEAIQALVRREGHEVVHLRGKFPADTPDVLWINQLATEQNWVIISGDVRITRNDHEKAKWLESRLTAFFLAKGWQNLTFWDQAAKLIQRWPDITEQALRVEPGAGFIVKPKSHRFEQVQIR